MLVEWKSMFALPQSPHQKRKVLQPYGLTCHQYWTWSRRRTLMSTRCISSVMGRVHSIGRRAISIYFCTKLHQCGFQSGTWNFFEASHGKGAPDGVGGLLKRTADRLVSHGKDIPNAELFFNALVDAKLAIKLFYISEDNVAEAVKNMPEGLPVVPSTMQIHQVVTVGERKITYRDVSCICSARQTLDCQCHPTKTFAFEATTPTQEHTNTQKQPEFAWQDADKIGKWCCLNYDHEIYPGIIQEISETHVEVKCMHRVGVNCFFWPAREDVLWYLHSDIITMIPPPTAVTSRHVEIDKETWGKISDM